MLTGSNAITWIKREMSTLPLWTFKPEEKLFFHAPSFNNRGQRIVEVSLSPNTTTYKDRPAIQICKESSMCVAKWPLQQVKEGDDGTRRDWKLIITDPEVVESLEKFDEFIIDKAYENRKEWFPRKEYTREQLADKLKGVYREQDDGTRCVQVKVKCPGATSLTQIQVQDENGRKTGSIDDLVKFAKTIPIVRIFNIWFMDGGSFGVTLQADKLLVYPPPKMEFTDYFHLSRPLTWVDNFEKIEEQM